MKLSLLGVAVGIVMPVIAAAQNPPIPVDTTKKDTTIKVDTTARDTTVVAPAPAPVPAPPPPMLAPPTPAPTAPMATTTSTSAPTNRAIKDSTERPKPVPPSDGTTCPWGCPTSSGTGGLTAAQFLALQQELRDDKCGLAHVTGRLDAATRVAIRNCARKMGVANNAAAVLVAFDIGYSAADVNTPAKQEE
jgi:hypothetical protein